MPSDLQTFPDGAAGVTVRGYINTLITRFQDVVNVKDWGALGNGTSDDTAGIQAALDNCFGSVDSPHGDAAKQTNKPIFFPAGVYVVNPPAALTVSGAADNGAGLVRLTTGSIGANYKTGHIVTVAGITGTVASAANGTWAITVVDDTHIDLRGTTFSGTWTSGGTVTRAALQVRNVRGGKILGAGRETTHVVTSTANGSIFAANGFDFSYAEDLSFYSHGTGVAFDVQADGTGTGTTGNTFERTNFLAAPTLVITSGTSDNTPDFTLNGDFAVGDTVRFQYGTASSFAGVSEVSNTIDAGEDAANSLDFDIVTALANGTWYFRARIERPSLGIGGWSNTQSVAISVGGGYVGPFDLAGAADFFLGLRAYSAAYATAGSPALDLSLSDGTGTVTINVLSNGKLDVAAANTAIAASKSTITKLYDQTGNGHHFVPDAPGNAPLLQITGGIPEMVTTASGPIRYSRSNAIARSKPYSFTYMARRDANFTARQDIFTGGGITYGFDAAANTITMNESNIVFTKTAADSTWHAVVNYVQAAIGSAMNVDGSETTATVDTGATGDLNVSNMSIPWAGLGIDGRQREWGLWPGAISRSAMTANMLAHYV